MPKYEVEFEDGSKRIVQDWRDLKRGEIITFYKYHWDLRFHIGKKYLDEFNLFKNPLETKEEEPIRAVKKKCADMEWMKIKRKGTRMKQYGVWSTVETIDHGSIEIIEDTPSFMSMNIYGKKLKGYHILKKNKPYVFMKSKLPKGELMELVEEYHKSLIGDPRTGSYYKPFHIEEKRNWDYFVTHIYDIKRFTKIESQDRVKDYLENISIPSGVTIGVGLYFMPGRIHNAKIAYIKFDKNKWNYEEAEQWIKSNKLHTWEHSQIRKKRKI